MTRVIVSLVAIFVSAPLAWGQPADADGLAEIVRMSNTLIVQANGLRGQAAAGKMSTTEARGGVAKLLKAFDEVDRRALRICQEAVDAEALAESADLVVHGPVLQCLYVLTEMDERFGEGLGYGVVYERFLQFTADDFRTENSLNDPAALLRHFGARGPRAVGVPWLDAEALEAVRSVDRARELLEGEQSIAERLSSLSEFAGRSRELLEGYSRTGNAGLIAGYLQTRLGLAQAYAILLERLTGDAKWSELGVGFAELAATALLRPEQMLAVFSDPEPRAEEPEEPRVRDLFLNWFEIFRDVFNQPKPYVWREDRRERGVDIGIEDGRLYIRGKSNPGWSRSGRVTWRWSGRSFVFSIAMGGSGKGYYRHMGVEGDTGWLVNLAFGGEWADSVFEISQDNERMVQYGRPASDLPSGRRHQGRIEYREDKQQVWGYIDEVLIGHGSVDLGRKKSFAIYVSSGDEVQYDAWFDDFDVRAP